MSELTEPQRLWVEALESGKYAQTTGCLQSRLGYCCLGVAAKVYQETTGNILPTKVSGLLKGSILGGAFTPVKQWLGLIDFAGQVTGTTFVGSNAYTSLVSANDFGESFTDIAKTIRSKPKGLFIN